MCGRFSQSQTRAEYLAYLADEVDSGFSAVPEPVGRYNVAPGTRVLLLSESNDQLKLDPVLWGYSPPWWHKAPLINARAETAAEGRMFAAAPLCLLTGGTSGCARGTINSRILFTAGTVSPCSWLPLARGRLD